MRLYNKITIVLLLILAIYLLIPTPGFPPHPPGSLSSLEPADTESIYRQAYYTQLSRQEIMSYYQNRLRYSQRQNHPPEEAYTLIRDQTRSSWLEELIHIGKDSFYINGYYPTTPTDQININGIHYQGKITVRYLPSNPITRLTILGLLGISIYLLFKEYVKN